jgi:peptidoglycan-N-acetylmuramic acid deacetylase
MFEKLKDELRALEDRYFEITGKPMAKYFRPPEGRFDHASMQRLKNLGYKTIFWSFAYADWDNNSQMSTTNAKQKIFDNIHNGEVMLLHPTSETNAKIMKDVILHLKSQGFTFGTLDELTQ